MENNKQRIIDQLEADALFKMSDPQSNEYKCLKNSLAGKTDEERVKILAFNKTSSSISPTVIKIYEDVYINGYKTAQEGAKDSSKKPSGFSVSKPTYLAGGVKMIKIRKLEPTFAVPDYAEYGK